MRKNDNYKMAKIMESLGINQDKTISNGDTKSGLAPWVGDNPIVLILGTLPTDVSLKKQAYYQNKSKNSFWKIMHSLWPED